MAVNVLAALHDYFGSCPVISGKVFNVAHLPEMPHDGIEFSIDVTPSDQVLEQHMRGHGFYRRLFVIESVNAYGADVWHNLENSGLYEQLEEWILENNRKRVFPHIAPYEPEGVFANTPGYILSAEPGMAQYQIQLELRFYK